MTTFVVFVVCSVRSSTANCSGWTQNLIRKHRGNVKDYRDSSLFSQEYAKELFEAQGNIIYKDISRKPKAPQDLISMASVLGKLKTNLCYLCDENHAMDTCAIQWRTGKCLPVKKIFLGVVFNHCLEDTIFLCGLLFQKPTMASPNCKDQHLPKKRSRTNKQKNSYKRLVCFLDFQKDFTWLKLIL